MGGLRRYIQAGATFAWPLSAEPLQEARDRHAITGAPGVVNSPYGRALSLGGVADYMVLGAAWEDQLRFDSGTQDFSIVAWVLHSVTGDFQQILDKRDGADDGWGLRTIADDTIQFSLDAIDISSASAVTEDIWHTIGVSVVRAGNMQIYLDGAADGASAAVGGEVMATTTNVHVGTRSFAPPVNLWTGAIAGIVLFPRALSAEEHAGTHSGGGPF